MATLAGLDPDVRLLVAGELGRELAWTITYGVAPVAASLAQSYKPDARVPGEGRGPSADEVARFTTAEAPAAGYGFVTLVRLPTEPVAGLRRYFELGQRTAEDDATAVDALKQILIDLARTLEIEGNVETRPASLDQPRQATLSRDDTRGARGPRVGLHVDHWSSGDLAARMHAPNRIGMNLGPGPRWLVFSPHSVCQLGERMPGIEPGNAKQFLVEIGAELPVIRLLIPPGAAYVAPTEAVFHDGSTLGSDRATLKQMLLGRFRPRRS